jgi:hypothetical protein
VLAKPEAQRCLTPISRATFSIGIVRQGLTLMAGAEAKIEVRCAQGCGAVCWHTGEGAFLLRTMALRPGGSPLEDVMDDQDAEIESIMTQVVEHIKALRQQIADTKVPEDQVWFRNFLFGILNCALTDYKSVQIGVKKLIALAAWGCRNLLEIKVITENLLRSEQDAIDLQNALTLDAREFYEAMSRSHTATFKQYLGLLSELANQEQGPMKAALIEKLRSDSKLGPQTAETDAEAEGFRQFQLSMGLEANAKPKMVNAMLRTDYEKDEFYPLNKICSKLVHRTVLSIASTNVEGSLDAIVPFLENSATTILLQIYDRIKRYVDAAGIVIPPKHAL